jgi:signal transduction histidine kinase
MSINEKNSDLVSSNMTQNVSVSSSKVADTNFFFSAIQSLMNLGVNDVHHHNQQKYIRVTNFIALNSLGGSILYAVLAFFWDQWYWMGATLLLGLVCILVLLLNYKGKTNASRMMYLFLAHLAVYLNGLFIGPLSQSENFFIIAVLIPFLIYDISEMTMIVLGVLFPMVLIYSYDFVEPLFKSIHLQDWQQLALRKVGVVMQIYLTIAAIYQLVRINKDTEQELEASNAQLMMQTAELKRSNSDLEQFAYIISHDLKTPVRNISSFMNLLMNKYSKEMNAEAQEFVSYSHHGAKRLERLIDDVLAYCRIGINLPKPVPVNVADIIHTIRYESRERLLNHNAVINVNRELPTINNVHSSLLYHIFQNLINNGLKFNKSEQPKVDINWTNSLNYYTFSVRDNGIGLSQSYADTIFQMFKRLHHEKDYEGTGIGLAICKKIIEYYHGEIWFESEIGKGTTFYFTIRKF